MNNIQEICNNISVYDIISEGYQYLGSGADKNVYAYNENLVIKATRTTLGRHCINMAGDTINCGSCSGCHNAITHRETITRYGSFADQICREVEVWDEAHEEYGDIICATYAFKEEPFKDSYFQFTLSERVTPLLVWKKSLKELSTKIQSPKEAPSDNKKDYGGTISFLESIGMEEWLDKAEAFCEEYGFSMSEQVSWRNMGITKDGKLKILDYGY